MSRRRLDWFLPVLAVCLACESTTGAPDDKASGSGGSSNGGSGSTATVDGVELSGMPLRSRFVRLTHAQWEMSVKDLLGLSAESGLSSGFTGDPPGPTFSNNERSLFVTSGLWGDYQRVAETLASELRADPQALAHLTGGTTSPDTFIATFGRHAFRRPLTPAEAARYQALFASAATLFTSGDAFSDGVELVVQAMLQSPYFVYRAELGPEGQPLTGYEVAAKLSFLLRNTLPDDALLDLAESGQLATTANIAAEVQSLLETGPAREVFQRFHSELFGLDRYAGLFKDADLFPSFTDGTTVDMKQADILFFDAIFAGNQGFNELLLSPLAFVNQSIAQYYGLSATGPDFQQVMLGPDRPGFFTRVGFLAFNASSRDPDPIHRGVEVNRRLLGLTALVPPPGIIPQLPAPSPGQTNRERVEAHTGKGTCGEGCHGSYINPIGFAFETFDAMGQSRTMDAGKPVDTRGQYEFADGVKSFSGAPELMQILASEAQTHTNYAAHLAEYCLGRDLDGEDETLVRDAAKTSAAQGSSIKQIVSQVVASPTFLNRGGP